MAARHSKRASRALLRLAEEDPAFAALTLWVHHRDGDTPPSGTEPSASGAPAWTDGETIWYGPGFAGHSLPEQVGLAAHHLAHVAFRHVARAQAQRLRHGDRFDGDLFNLAADAIVNEMLVLAGHVLPRPCPRLGPMLEQALGRQKGSGPVLADWDVERLYLALQRPPGPQNGGDGAARAKGTGPSEKARAYALRQGYSPDLDTHTADPGGPPRVIAQDAEWRQRLTRALEEGRQAGRGIGALGHRIADLPVSEVPWERHLRGFLARALTHEPARAWNRPSGRWLAAEAEARRTRRPAPVFEPGRRTADPVLRIVLGIDSSSSIDQATLELFLAQVSAIRSRVGCDLFVIVFDEVVHSIRKMPVTGWQAEVAQIAVTRDGGTCLDGVFEAALDLSPSVLVVLTDLDTPLPARPTRLPVIWAVPSPVDEAPVWGRLIHLGR